LLSLRKIVAVLILTKHILSDDKKVVRIICSNTSEFMLIQIQF